MSLNGNLTSLEINVKSGLYQNSGLTISARAIEYQGNWLPGSYTQGKLTANTALNFITEALPNLYSMVDNGNLDIAVYRNALTIGRPINIVTDNRINCPALGNSRPDEFKTSYAGYGTWKPVTVDAYKNVTGPGPLTLVSDVYPPQDYPVTGVYSYIYNNWGSTTSGPYVYNYQWDHPYAWVTGWPGKSSWQATDDSYSAAYFPRPDIRVRDQSLIEYDEYFKNGFIGTVARQAYYEFWYNHSTRRPNQYAEFINSFQQCYNWYNTANQKIGEAVNSKTYIKGSYSNINDLTTNDISGVSLAFKIFGNDLILTGKAINLERINQFGLPSVLLGTLQKYSALTDAVKFALLYNELSIIEINSVLSGSIPTKEQENKIYRSFLMITENDLTQIKIILNIQTQYLNSLADLLNPMKLFPNSYNSLTVPRYSMTANSAKIYDFIYINGGVNSRIDNWGTYLDSILPADIALASGAFRATMCQIKNINSMSIESFSQVVANLEVTNLDLPLINSASGTPVDFDLATDLTNLIALGSGNSGAYRMCDFYGAMSGYPYRDQYASALALLNQTATSSLSNVYQKIYQMSLFNGWELPTRGRGWVDPIINPSPVWGPEFAYTLYVTQQYQNAGDNSVIVQGNLTGIYIGGSQIAFQSAPVISYTVTSRSYDAVTNTTRINFAPGLSGSLNTGTPVYIYYDVTTIGYADTVVQDLISAANLEILRITVAFPDTIERLNYYWNKIGQQLFLEQRAIPYAITTTSGVYNEGDKSYIDSFLTSAAQYALNTEYASAGPILEAIADSTVVSGQSLIGALRESRNNARLANTDASLDNAVPAYLNNVQASALITGVDSQGAIIEIKVTFGGWGYDNANPPKVRIGPYGGAYGGTGSGATATAILDNSVIISIIINTSGKDYSISNGYLPVYIDPPPAPARLGAANVPGSFAGSPYTGEYPIPTNLVSSNTASYTVDSAIQQVTICNCDCWNP